MQRHKIDDQAALVQIWLGDRRCLTLDYLGVLFGVVPPTSALFHERWVLRPGSQSPSPMRGLSTVARPSWRLYGRVSGLSPSLVHFAGLRIVAPHTGIMHADINPCQGFFAALYDTLGQFLRERQYQLFTCLSPLTCSASFQPIGSLQMNAWPLTPQMDEPSAVSPCSPPKAPKPRHSQSLEIGQYMATQSSLVSSSGTYEAVIDGHSQICMRQVNGNSFGCWPRREWLQYRGIRKDTSGGSLAANGVDLKIIKGNETDGPHFVSFQRDGNLCMYRGTGPQQNLGAIWCLQAPRCANKPCSLQVEQGSRLSIVLGVHRLWQLHFPEDGGAPAGLPSPLDSGATQMHAGDFLLPCVSSLVSARGNFELIVSHAKLCRIGGASDEGLICLGRPSDSVQMHSDSFFMISPSGGACMFSGSDPLSNKGMVWCIAEHANCSGRGGCRVSLSDEGFLEFFHGMSVVERHGFDQQVAFDTGVSVASGHAMEEQRSPCSVEFANASLHQIETGWRLHHGQVLESGLHRAFINAHGQMCVGSKVEGPLDACFPPQRVSRAPAARSHVPAANLSLGLNYSGYLCMSMEVSDKQRALWCALLVPCIAISCTLIPTSGDVIVHGLTGSYFRLRRCLNSAAPLATATHVPMCAAESNEVDALSLTRHAALRQTQGMHGFWWSLVRLGGMVACTTVVMWRCKPRAHTLRMSVILCTSAVLWLNSTQMVN